MTKKEANAAYYKRHRDKIRVKQNAWRKKNLKKARAYA